MFQKGKMVDFRVSRIEPRYGSRIRIRFRPNDADPCGSGSLRIRMLLPSPDPGQKSSLLEVYMSEYDRATDRPTDTKEVLKQDFIFQVHVTLICIGFKSFSLSFKIESV